MNTNYKLLQIFLIAIIAISCSSKASKPALSDEKSTPEADSTSTELTDDSNAKKINSAIEILNKTEVPILCYHRIEDGRNDIYTVSPEVFASHLQILADSGYNSVQPDELYDYLVHNAPLPEKPFMITFDDSRTEHFSIAATELEKRNFRGAFFIMTVTNNKKKYLSTDEIAELASRGHSIGLHSWDHVMVTKYTDSTFWEKQVINPKNKLENMIDKPIEHWAYPNGVYNREAARELDKHFKLSFILQAKRDSIYPLQTVRRTIVPSDAPERLLRRMESSFN